MTSTEELTREAIASFVNTLDIPPVEMIYAQAERPIPTGPAKRHMTPKALIGTAVVLAITIPAAAAIVTGNFPNPIAGVNPDNKNQTLTSPLPRTQVGTQAVPGGYVTLTAYTGPSGGSCYTLEMSTRAGGPVQQAVSSCGAKDATTTVSNLLGAGVLHTGDQRATRIRIVDSNGTTYESDVRAGYALVPQLPPGNNSVTTLDIHGKAIGEHEIAIPAQLPPMKHS